MNGGAFAENSMVDQIDYFVVLVLFVVSFKVERRMSKVKRH